MAEDYSLGKEASRDSAECGYPRSLRARNIQRYRRLDFVDRGEASLVDGQSDSATGINVQQRLVERHIAEGAHEEQVQCLIPKRHVDVFPVLVSELKKLVAIEVGYQVAEWPVGRNDLAMQPTVVHFGRSKI